MRGECVGEGSLVEEAVGGMLGLKRRRKRQQEGQEGRVKICKVQRRAGLLVGG